MISEYEKQIRKEGEPMTHFLRRDSPILHFYAYPKFLLTQDLSETAKVIYMLLLDRSKLSMQTDGWQDEWGHVFVHYTIQSLAAAFGKSEMTVKNALKALEHQGLIYRQRQGAGLPSRIFVKLQTEIRPTRGAENCLAGGTDFDHQTERKLSTNKIKNKKKEKYYEDYDYEEGESL